MRAEEFVARLSGVARSGQGWVARCPAHDDNRASLSVGEGDDLRVLLKCFAGCTAEAIVAARGLEMSDLMPERERRKAKPRGEPVATYPYKDADGTLLYEVLRYVPKDFRQRRPDGKGGWVWHLDCDKPEECRKKKHEPLTRRVKRVLYRLPELMAADPSRPVFNPEGEKDCERLEALEFLATTNAGGAEKWQPDFSEPLRGRRVIILPDNDEPGRKHGQAVARFLHGVAARASVLELAGFPPAARPDWRMPEKGDVSDWLDAGGTVEELERLALEAPEWSPPPVPVLAELLAELVSLICRFVVMSKAQAVAWALWVAHTHGLDAADETPYLSITSPEKRSGKTRVLEVSEHIVARPWLTGRVSAAALVRKIDKVAPTFLLDESDAAFNGDEAYSEALRGILNTGHRRGGRASLCIGQGSSIDVHDFSTFCPKAIAGIGKLPDTVADRAIPIRLQRKERTEKVERFRARKARAETSPLLARLESWAAASVPALRGAEPALPEELSDRAQDGAEPLLAIADLAGGDWPKRAREALVELFTGDNPEDDSLGVRLLRDCRAVFDARPNEDKLSSADLCAELVKLEESPWLGLHKGKSLTVRDVARLLNPYGIAPRPVRLGEKTPRGYYRDFFEDAWSRYLAPGGSPSATPQQGNTGAGFDDFSERNTKEPVADEKREAVNAGAGCGGVADETPPGECVHENADDGADGEAALL